MAKKDSVVLKEWLDANNIKNITPVGRASVVNVYYNSPDETGFGMDDANSIFDYMEDNGYPKIREVYEILKSRCINNKKVSSFLYHLHCSPYQHLFFVDKSVLSVIHLLFPRLWLMHIRWK